MFDEMQRYDAAHGTRLCQELASTCERGFCLTTAYSGLGAAEAASREIVDEVDQRIGAESPSVNLVVHAACDLLVESKVALSKHKPGSKPERPRK